MMITPEQLSGFGEDVCGPSWKSELARRLNISRRTLYSYTEGQQAIPADLRATLIAVAEKQLTVLNEHILRLGTSFLQTAKELGADEEAPETDRVLRRTVTPERAQRKG